MTINNDDIDAMNARAYRRARMAEGAGEEQIATAVGVFCLIHGTYDCPEPSCWRCGNHLVHDERCAAPTCRATVTPEVVALVRELGVESPVELLTYEIGRMLSRAGRQSVGSESEHASDPTSLKVKP